MAIFLILAVLATSIKVISPYSKGIYIRMGRFVRVLDQGINMVTPLMSDVIIVDLRAQRRVVNSTRLYSEDGRNVKCSITVVFAAEDAKKVFFEATNYRTEMDKLTEEEARKVFSRVKYVDIASSRNMIESRIKSGLSGAAGKLGVKVHDVELEEFEPSLVLCPQCGFTNPISNVHCGGCGVLLKNRPT